MPNHPRHPLGSQARVLLTSVFGPYAQDDGVGSRVINPMELYHNQVTRVQQAYSLRTFQRSWGLMLIHVNLQAPCKLLDFPSEQRFLQEIKTNQYDIIGISSIQTNLLKVRKMCKLIRKHQPQATLVLGGHIANLPGLDKWCAPDHIVTGDGVRWMREFLGEEGNAPLKHPQVLANIDTRIMGVNLKNHPGDVAATLIPSAGCPLGCNFCSTSAMFGGKGKSVKFYESGQELFDIMCQLESNLRVKAFFVMDENFLVDKKRALELLELMQKHRKPWSLYLFSSANILQKYTAEQLVDLGVCWVWMGLEGKDSQYKKLAGTDTQTLVAGLREHGIRVLGSSIIGLESHTPENIDEAIEHAVKHRTEFHQFMLYTPIPGTALYRELEQKGTLLATADISVPDIHGQLKFNFHPPHIKDGQETELLLRAFHRDFEVNGPSLIRIIRTNLMGWKRYRHHSDRRIRARFAHEAANLPFKYAGVLWATRQAYRHDARLVAELDSLLSELQQVCGWKSRFAAPIVGRYLLHKLQAEQQRLAAGWTYEPPTFYESNQADETGTAKYVPGIAATCATASSTDIPQGRQDAAA